MQLSIRNHNQGLYLRTGYRNQGLFLKTGYRNQGLNFANRLP